MSCPERIRCDHVQYSHSLAAKQVDGTMQRVGEFERFSKMSDDISNLDNASQPASHHVPTNPQRPGRNALVRVALALVVALLFQAAVIGLYIFSDIVIGDEFIGRNGDWPVFTVGIAGVAWLAIFPAALLATLSVSASRAQRWLRALRHLSIVVLLCAIVTFIATFQKMVHRDQQMLAISLLALWALGALGVPSLALRWCSRTDATS